MICGGLQADVFNQGTNHMLLASVKAAIELRSDE
jgi:hypothetical protein